MKKIRLLMVGFGLLLTIVSSGQVINFRLVDPRIIKIGAVDKFEFYVQVMASTTGTYLWSGQVSINFNSLALSSTLGDWTATKIPIDFSTYNNDGTQGTPKYNTTRSTSAGYFLLGFVPGDNATSANGPNPLDFYEIPNVWTTLYKVSVKITDVNGLAGINIEGNAMNNQQSYIDAINSTKLYSNSVPWDPSNFTNTYLGRVYCNTLGWSQVGNSSAAQWVNWGTSVNTSVWDGTAIIPTTGVLLASNLRVHSPATLTIPNTGQLTVSGATEVNTVNGLTIQSDATGTGSLITATASGTGSTVAQRWMTAGKWNIVSSPLSGQTVANFLTNNPVSGNNGIAVKSGNVGILEYLSGPTNAWSLASSTGPAGNLDAGKGFSMRIPGLTAVTNDGSVTFNGAIQAGTVNPPVTPFATTGYWNCVGNPYTSAIRMTDNTTPTPLANFLTANVANLVSGSAIYVWQAPDISNGLTGKYTTYSNATSTDIQEGQAFLVNVVASPLTFNSAIQIHNTSLALKSTGNIWPTIKLEAAVDEQKSSTIIAFNSGMTKGLDPTYDASLLKGGTDLLVYTKLVEDNGIPFAIQALPDNEYSSMIIPVGIDFKTGGVVVFSAELMSMPSDSKVILEDKLLKTFTDLSENDYTVTIAANSSISDRFQLHTSYQTTGLSEGSFDKTTLSAYAVRNIEIRVKGAVSKQAIATLYDVQGRVVVMKKMEEGSLNIIPTPNIKTGIYMLFVKDGGKMQGFKIPVNE